MRRVDRKRRQQWEDVVEEMVLDPGSFGFCNVPAIDKDDTDLGEDGAHIAPDRLLINGEI